MEILPAIQEVRIRQEGTRVLVIKDGRTLLDLPWQAALDLAKALQAKGKRAEEIDRAPAIIADQAIITRLGLRFGLTSHPAMLREAAKEAAWNSHLRRCIPSAKAGGIASQSIVPAPIVIQHKKEAP
jgi:hypothetical protein